MIDNRRHRWIDMCGNASAYYAIFSVYEEDGHAEA